MRDKKGLIASVMALWWLKEMDNQPGLSGSLILSTIGIVFAPIVFIYGLWGGDLTIAWGNGGAVFIICEGLSLFQWLNESWGSGFSEKIIRFPALLLCLCAAFVTVNDSFKSASFQKYKLALEAANNTPEIIAARQQAQHESLVKMQSDSDIIAEACKLVDNEDAQAEALLNKQLADLHNAQRLANARGDYSVDYDQKITDLLVTPNSLDVDKATADHDARVLAKENEIRHEKGLPPVSN